MLLDPDDLAGFLLLGRGHRLAVGRRLDRFEGLGQIRRGRFVQRNRGLVAVVHLLPVLAAAQPAFQLVHGGLERSVETVRTALAADNRPLAGVRGDLHMLGVLALTPVVLVGEFDVEAMDGVVDPLGPGEFLGDVDPVVIGDLDVAARHLDIGIGGGSGVLVGVRQLSGIRGIG